MFNYETIKDAEVRKQFKSVSDQIKQINMKRSVALLDVGRQLWLVKNSDTKVFRAWAKQEFSWTLPTTYNYMNTWKVFGGLSPEILRCFQPSALVMLSRKNVTQKVRSRAIKLAKSGTTISNSVACSLVRNSIPIRKDAGVSRSLSKFVKAINYLDEQTSHLIGNYTPQERETLKKKLRSIIKKIEVATILNEINYAD